MDVPGVILKAYDNSKGKFGPFHLEGVVGLSPRIKTEVMIHKGDPKAMLTALKKIYEDPPFDELKMWPVAREWLERELIKNSMSLDILPDP